MIASAADSRLPELGNGLAAFRTIVLLALASLLLIIPGNAQNVALRAKIEASLPAEAQTVMTRLFTLSELPDGQWKMHSGDIAHGETIGLDESGWQPIATESKAPKEALWFRQTITVPPTLNGYDLTGARIWFQFHANANGPMPQILYFNGRRVALGDDLEPIVLFDEAKPGDKVVVAVKLLHTVDEKTFRGSTMRIEFPASRPNPGPHLRQRRPVQSGYLSRPRCIPPANLQRPSARERACVVGPAEACPARCLTAAPVVDREASHLDPLDESGPS